MIYIFGGAFDPPHVGHTAIIQTLLAKKQGVKIIIIPSSERDDKKYNVSDAARLEMLDIFVREIGDDRVFVDDYFIRNWKGEMITRDVDEYAKRKYGEDIVHIFWTDTIESMPDWDSEGYAAKKVKKMFVPRSTSSPSFWAERRIHAPDKNTGSFVPQDEGNRGLEKIENFEFFTDCHIPDISSTELRKIIPEYTGLEILYSHNPKFIIPGLSKKISEYILENRCYRPKITNKPKVLVHVCCGPDVTMPILALKDEYDLICFWYDPNIQPKEEYDKRYDAFVKVCEIEGIPYIKGAYDVKHFFTRIKWLEFTPEKGEKCTNCYDMRMYVAAKLAKKLKIPYYTSSLNTSPKKDLEKLFLIGEEYGKKFWVEFLAIPFRKRGGFEKSVEYTREHDIFRQNYCGCIYSIPEGGESEMKKKFVW
jgi:predicted adenine nucleotide alpha hydrolase (AANH) superfamily ATPase/nicotinic acid mononucleotide adenylyltransferase